MLPDVLAMPVVPLVTLVSSFLWLPSRNIILSNPENPPKCELEPKEVGLYTLHFDRGAADFEV